MIADWRRLVRHFTPQGITSIAGFRPVLLGGRRAMVSA